MINNRQIQFNYNIDLGPKFYSKRELVLLPVRIPYNSLHTFQYISFKDNLLGEHGGLRTTHANQKILISSAIFL